MNDLAQSFVLHLQKLEEAQERAALAALRRSAGFVPGSYPPAYPYVERFVPADRHADDALRQALYLVAALFALHPAHLAGDSLAAGFGRLMRQRDSDSIEKRFITLLAAEPEQLPNYLRQVVSLLAADGIGVDFVQLLRDLTRWLHPFQIDSRDKVRQHWARDFYRALNAQSQDSDNTDNASND